MRLNIHIDESLNLFAKTIIQELNMRRRRRPHSRARHGLQHIGDLLPKLLAEIEECDVVESAIDSDASSMLEKNTPAEKQPDLAVAPTMASDPQTMFAFHQTADF